MCRFGRCSAVDGVLDECGGEGGTRLDCCGGVEIALNEMRKQGWKNK